MLLYWSLTWHTSARNQNTLKIPKGQPEDINQRTGNIISKQYNKAQQKSTKHYTKNWRLNNAENQRWTQLLRKDSRRVVLFKFGDKTWKGLRRTRLWLRQAEIHLKYPWSCMTHDIATVSEEKMATVCSDYRNVLPIWKVHNEKIEIISFVMQFRFSRSLDVDQDINQIYLYLLYPLC